MLTVPISVGELLDKITILEIKTEKIYDQSKLVNIWNELNSLKALAEDYKSIITEELKLVNQNLWEIEEKIREKEKLQQFDEEFIHLARSVYINNDKRSELKRKINLETNSSLIEEKSY